MAPIVLVPADARPLDGVPEALGALARAWRRVGVLSGRPVSFLQPWFAPEVTLAGLYGLELRSNGVSSEHPVSGNWRDVVDDVAAVSRARGPASMRIEAKGVSLTLHYREHPEVADDVARWADLQASRSGLVMRQARMSYELHPPIAVDKGTALTELSVGLQAVCFIGDDVADLPAFDALDGLAGRGVHVARIAIRSVEESAELVRRADATVAGPAAVLELVRSLAAR